MAGAVNSFGMPESGAKAVNTRWRSILEIAPLFHVMMDDIGEYIRDGT